MMVERGILGLMLNNRGGDKKPRSVKGIQFSQCSVAQSVACSTVNLKVESSPLSCARLDISRDLVAIKNL